MQNDEREPRDTTNDPQEAEDAAEADEFETASWPSRDTAAEPPPEAEAYDAAAPAGEEEAHEPPPPDVEAHTPPDAAGPAAAAAAVPAHSVPATEPGESTKCPRCGTENRPGIAFCRNCGQRLVAAVELLPLAARHAVQLVDAPNFPLVFR